MRAYLIALALLTLAGLLSARPIGRAARWRAMEQELERHHREWRLGL